MRVHGGFFLLAGFVIWGAGCGGELSSDLSGGLRDGDGSGLYLDLSEESLRSPSEESDEVSLEDLDLEEGLGSLSDLLFGEREGYPVIFCEDASSNVIEEWTGCSTADSAWTYIPEKFVEGSGTDYLEELTLAIHKIQESGDSESRQELLKFLQKYQGQKELAETYSNIAVLGAFLVGARTTMALVLDHTDVSRMQKLPKFFKFAADLKIRRSLMRFVRARLLKYGSPVILAAGAGLMWHGQRVRSNMLSSVTFDSPNDEVAVHPTLEIFLQGKKGSQGEVLDVADVSFALLSTDLAIELIEELEAEEERMRVDSVFRRMVR